AALERVRDALVVSGHPHLARAGGERAPGHVQHQRLATEQPQRLAGQPGGVVAGGNGDDEVEGIHGEDSTGCLAITFAARILVAVPSPRGPLQERLQPRPADMRTAMRGRRCGEAAIGSFSPSSWVVAAEAAPTGNAGQAVADD